MAKNIPLTLPVFGSYFFIFITAIAALSGILFGYDTGVVSGAILFITDEFHLSAKTNGIVVSAVLFGAGTLPALGFFLGLLYLPDSPRWHAARGETNKALHILQRIHGNKQQAALELIAIEDSLQHQKQDWRLLFSPMVRSTLTIGIGLAVIQQITGINTIIYYAPTIFKMAGFQSASSAILATMSVGIIFVLFTLVALPLIDTIGRRPLLLIGMGGMALSLLALSWAFHFTSPLPSLKWITITSMLFYIACFAFSLGPIVWLMIAEIYPLKVRGLGCSLATAANWGSNMLVAYTFLSLIETFGASGAFLLYFCISIGGIAFIYFLIPETKSVTLEQIEKNLQAGLSFRKLGLKNLATAEEE